jgi:SET domain-containing protein
VVVVVVVVVTLIVYVPKHHTGLYAIDDIPANTELTFSYGPTANERPFVKCLCGAEGCSSSE